MLRRVFERFLDDLSLRSVGDLASLSGAYRVEVGRPPEIPEFWREAIERKQEVRIRYRSDDGVTERINDPLSFLERYGSRYVVAFCNLRMERRVFRVDMISVKSQ